jgi:hypothetical protein
VNVRQIGVEFLADRFKFRKCLLRGERMLVDLRAVNLDMLEPYRLIEMLEPDLQVGCRFQ